MREDERSGKNEDKQEGNKNKKPNKQGHSISVGLSTEGTVCRVCMAKQEQFFLREDAANAN